MNSHDSHRFADSVAEVLQHLRHKGVRLWCENDQLQYSAPKGALTPEDKERLRHSKGDIIARLKAANSTNAMAPRLEPRESSDTIPLTFSQWSHWNWYELGERQNLRQIASAIRLRGRLNPDALQMSVTEIMRRHEALRTRVTIRDGVPVQQVCAPVDHELKISDLTGIPPSLRETAIVRAIEEHILEPIDVTRGPLFDVWLLRLGVEDHVLIAAIEHTISDMFSMSILLRELQTAYAQLSSGRVILLPEIPVQYGDFAVWQAKAHATWLEMHGAYWKERLSGCQRVRFPADRNLPVSARMGWGTAPVRIEKGMKAELREWCRIRRTTLPMSILTAYAATVLRWCDVSDGVIQYVTDGRSNAKIRDTIGFFAYPLSLRVQLRQEDTFVDLLNRVTGEYCTAYEHADAGYVSAQVPRPAFARNCTFNWIPYGSNSWVAQGATFNLSGSDGSPSAITCEAVEFEHPIFKVIEADREPFILLFDTDDGIVGGVHFPASRFSADIMERFVRNLAVFAQTLLRQPQQRVKDIRLV